MDTVEEMKKLNARRRLKGAVMAAVASPKWSLDPSDPDHFSDYGDDDVTSAGLYIGYFRSLVTSYDSIRICFGWMPSNVF